MKTSMMAAALVAACGSSGSSGSGGRAVGSGGDEAAAVMGEARDTPPPPTPCSLPRESWRFPAVPRVVAIGDVHGDLAATRRALRRGGLVDQDDQWSGGATWVVQVGDQLDRGDDEQAILDLFERLESQATAAGGRFLWLLGNHEIMNAAGDMAYVTPGGFRDFEDVAGLPLAKFAKIPASARARVAAFAPGGPYATILSGQHIVVAIGATVFVHGGIAPGVAARLDDADHAARCWLRGNGVMPAAVADPEGPLWDRTLAGDVVDCARLEQVLAELGAARLVIAHTPQPAGISSACDERVWRVDVGLSRHYGGPTEVLEITAAGAVPLR